MVSQGLALRLKPGVYDEYKRRHDELWPEMARMFHRCQLSMVIYRWEDMLFVHQTAPSQESFEAAAADPITPKWNEHMKEVLESDEQGELIFEELPLAFRFGVFDG